MPHSLGPLIAYHGCDLSVGEAVLAGKMDLRPSCNDYDWLGEGIYFWVGSAERGLDWARELAARKEAGIRQPFVLGALIFPQHCLNLTDYRVVPELRAAYEYLARLAIRSPMSLPGNTVPRGGIFMRRALDCAVINTVHEMRDQKGAGHDGNASSFDTVYGVFEEGGEIYPGAAFRSKTHIQIAVRNPDCIVGYFRVPKTERPPALSRAA